MRRSILILLGIWLAIVVVGTMHTYGDITTTNAGVWWYIHPTDHRCGFEYRGHIGFFCDVT